MDISHISYAEQKVLHREYLDVYGYECVHGGCWLWEAEHFWKFVELVPVEDIPQVLAVGEMPRKWHPGTELHYQRPINFDIKGDQFKCALEFILQRLT